MLVFYIVLAAVIFGLGVALAMIHKLHWTIFAVTTIVALLLPLPVSAITLAVSKDQKQTFNEYWNGYETGAVQRDVACYRDGVCVHTYDCDPYVVMETEYYTEYHTEYYTDSDGRSQSRQVGVQKSRQVPKTKYHSCPYSTQETSYYVNSTLGSFTIASNLMTGEQFRWGHPIPGGQITEPPLLWSQAKQRIDSGNPGAVSKVNSYKNFILASERTLFKRYSDIIEELKEDNLLPAPASGITSHYVADKLHVVGNLNGVDENALRHDLQQLNGAVGTELRGDLHVVLVEASKIPTSPENYGNALLAHWQDTDAFGKDAIAKNAIIVVMAIEPYKTPKATPVASPEPSASPEVTEEAEPVVEAPKVEEPTIANGTPVVKWAYAATGMPMGNEALLTELSVDLVGVPVDANIFGSPRYDISKSKVIHTDGVLESMLWGKNKFVRVSMESKDEDDNGSGFGYLADQWQPEESTMSFIFVLSGILSGLALAGGALLSIRARDEGTKDYLREIFSNS